MERRTFVLGAGASLLSQAAPSDQFNLGIIGPGSRGQFLMKTFAEVAPVRFEGVCDVYEPNLEAGLSVAKGTAKPYRNYMALLDNKSIQAVIIATPEHWHHQMLLDAMSAGKDVYIKKQLCH